MPNHLKFCSCIQCRRGLHASRGKALARRAVRRARHRAKLMLKRGEEPPRAEAVGYTD